MRITLKLFAVLSNYLPAEAYKNQIEIEAPDGATPADVMGLFGVPPEMAHLVLINGIFVAPSQRGLKRLAEGDHLAMWPPVAGG
jgi:molybdopterin synthase sulfur carrier subunit